MRVVTQAPFYQISQQLAIPRIHSPQKVIQAPFIQIQCSPVVQKLVRAQIGHCNHQNSDCPTFRFLVNLVHLRMCALEHRKVLRWNRAFGYLEHGLYVGIAYFPKNGRIREFGLPILIYEYITGSKITMHTTRIQHYLLHLNYSFQYIPDFWLRKKFLKIKIFKKKFTPVCDRLIISPSKSRSKYSRITTSFLLVEQAPQTLLQGLSNSFDWIVIKQSERYSGVEMCCLIRLAVASSSILSCLIQTSSPVCLFFWTVISPNLLSCSVLIASYLRRSLASM